MVGVAVLVAAIGCAKAGFVPRPEPVDLSPLLNGPVDPSLRLFAAFPDYDALALGRISQITGEVRRDGVIDLVSHTYDFDPEHARSWFIDVSVTLFDSADRAIRDLDSSCNSFARGGASGHPVRWQEGSYCLSSVLDRPTDPRDPHETSRVHESWVFVRRDRIVVRLYEHHKKSAASAKNQIIAKVAERLAGNPAASAL
jgi:hypothetical protein